MTDAGPNGNAPDASRAPLTGDDAHPNTIVITSFATLMEARAWPAFSSLLDPNVVYEIPREESGSAAAIGTCSSTPSSRATGT